MKTEQEIKSMLAEINGKQGNMFKLYEQGLSEQTEKGRWWEDCLKWVLK